MKMGFRDGIIFTLAIFVILFQMALVVFGVWVVWMLLKHFGVI